MKIIIKENKEHYYLNKAEQKFLDTIRFNFLNKEIQSSIFRDLMSNAEIIDKDNNIKERLKIGL